ncbi:MAG: diguanylate cyclase [Candidatus Omnitrophota bacterium]|nr:diguanylate cyclase [Candidatus Omnitrophota bacterium]
MSSEEINVLVIDINASTRKLWQEFLLNEGYKTESAATIDEALRLAQKGYFKIIILDITAKEKSGFEELQNFKNINHKICVIVSTARPSIKSAVEAMREGAYDYVSMPFEPEEIRMVLRRAVERYYLLVEANQKEYYRELSIIDGLTGLHNHRYFHEIILREFSRAKRYPQAFSLLMVDIDAFKSYNDTHGHLAGDDLLKSVGRFFVESIRCVDMVFRYGGEEFAILLPQTSKEGASAVAARIVNLIQKSTPITISVGVASFPEDGQSKEELIDHADKALYQAKCLGKGRMCVFDREKQ